MDSNLTETEAKQVQAITVSAQQLNKNQLHVLKLNVDFLINKNVVNAKTVAPAQSTR